jgi:DNA polymerase-3 subunit delta'
VNEDPSGARAAWAPLPPWHAGTAAGLLAAKDRWPHALLLVGRRGLGKRALALHLARALLCEAPGPQGSACGQCAGCTLAERASHPDLRLLEPVTYDDEGNATPVDTITVDAIRDLIAFALLSSHRGGAKVAVIAPVDALNAAAANALLKTLEEPPPATFLLLVSDQPGRLPATIVSRCRRLPVTEPDATVATAWLAERSVAHPALVLAQAGGAPLLALALADPALQRGREQLLDDLARPERLSPVAVGARLDAAPKDERRAELGSALYWLLTWTADLATVSGGGAARFHPDRQQALAELAPRVARVPLFRYYRTLLRQRSLLAHPLQPRLIAEAMLFDYRALFARSRPA